mmetsp:Transcript_2854/g.6854  ORF Transcript_2854/g.6854 Transcript_2854/m.6854 type:complete len:97 (+) Transcript_2854:484-774(+)
MSGEQKNDHSSLPESTSMWSIRPYPDLIDTSKIEADGGKWIRLDDGRIVEYFVSGSSSSDATVLVNRPGRLPGWKLHRSHVLCVFLMGRCRRVARF